MAGALWCLAHLVQIWRLFRSCPISACRFGAHVLAIERVKSSKGFEVMLENSNRSKL